DEVPIAPPEVPPDELPPPVVPWTPPVNSSPMIWRQPQPVASASKSGPARAMYRRAASAAPRGFAPITHDWTTGLVGVQRALLGEREVRIPYCRRRETWRE